QFSAAHPLLARCCQIADLLVRHLDILFSLAAEDFADIRQVLGTGSGADSPGWLAIRAISRDVDGVLSRHIPAQSTEDPACWGDEPRGLRECIYGILEWDDLLIKWRERHLALARDLLGAQAVGTQGQHLHDLAGLTSRRACPRTWQKTLGGSSASAWASREA
ncbi:MAG: hypothetical protein ACRC0L_12140, partial [Angustibacter sp.]